VRTNVSTPVLFEWFEDGERQQFEGRYSVGLRPGDYVEVDARIMKVISMVNSVDKDGWQLVAFVELLERIDV